MPGHLLLKNCVQDFVYLVAYGSLGLDRPMVEVHCFNAEHFFVSVHREEVPAVAEACSSCSAGAAGCKDFLYGTGRGASGPAEITHPVGVPLTCLTWQNRHLFPPSRSRC